MSKAGIVKRLIELGVPCPTAYKRQSGMNYHNPTLVGQPQWSASSVRTILQNRMYLGHMVQGKQRVKSYKVHTRVNLAEDAWFVKENTHEPIVEQAIFEQAQELMLRDTRTPPNSSRLHPFSGFLRCADCEKAMCRRPVKQLVYYACRTHTTTGLCSRHSIRHDRLEGVVLAVLNRQIDLLENLDALIDSVASAPAERPATQRLERALQLRRGELAKTQALCDGLYGDWKAGIITFEAYQRMKAAHEEKEAALKHGIVNLEAELHNAADTAPHNPGFEAFRERRTFAELNRGLVVELIHEIHIHEGGDLEITFTFQAPQSAQCALPALAICAGSRA